jgi:hypothetical protein
MYDWSTGSFIEPCDNDQMYASSTTVTKKNFIFDLDTPRFEQLTCETVGSHASLV